MNIQNCLLSIILLHFAGLNVRSQELGACKAYLHNDTLTLENDIIYQHFKWNDGNLLRLAFGTKQSVRSVITPRLKRGSYRR